MTEIQILLMAVTQPAQSNKGIFVNLYFLQIAILIALMVKSLDLKNVMIITHRQTMAVPHVSLINTIPVLVSLLFVFHAQMAS